MMDKHSRFYEFGKVRYYPQRRVLTSLDGKKESNLSNQSQDFLLVLLARAGKIASHAEIWAAVWPDEKRSVDDQAEKAAIKRSIAEAKLNLLKCLRAVGGEAKMIEAVHGAGYRLNARVQERQNGERPPQKAKRTPETAVKVAHTPLSANAPATAKPPSEPAPLPASVTGLRPAANTETGYVLAVSGLFAALFVIALFLEIAYAWGSYGASAARVAPFVWLWMGGAMGGGLLLIERVTQRN